MMLEISASAAPTPFKGCHLRIKKKIKAIIIYLF